MFDIQSITDLSKSEIMDNTIRKEFLTAMKYFQKHSTYVEI